MRVSVDNEHGEANDVVFGQLYDIVRGHDQDHGTVILLRTEHACVTLTQSEVNHAYQALHSSRGRETRESIYGSDN